MPASAFKPALTWALDVMTNSVPADISGQLSRAMDVIERHVASTLLAVHLHGSALDGGLKPYSDIDLLVTVMAGPDAVTRRALVSDLLKISAPPGRNRTLRALEVTMVVRSDVVPWHHPAKRELQFGEWLRDDILAGRVEPAAIDPDLAILLTQARQRSVALAGPPASEFFDPVPASDFLGAMTDAMEQWRTPSDWTGDERNVLLALVRIWYSAATGKIAPKDVAADWATGRLPEEHRSVLSEARQAYLGYGEDHLAMRGDRLTAVVMHIKQEVANLPGRRQ